ncbi:hypothetical protein TRFO_16517 [Tritrichomonas foetus]|uniref:Importin N-terminal domain-containing protein n=1 Tax=Tritrichomonas foetus TaxID=1144522 RepID=A0A1J4KPV3_9EUKA|nr:hypothetical protein TRFO_16517 [Tritrichomonas foetus]|eukprot:OHT13319.1 hypothetical protein TRFO_16517 [Tritrichomonas foetus]
MVEHFRELFRHSLVPNDQIVQESTKQLVELYQNPESIFPLISLLNPTEEIGMRRAASIGIKFTLINCWEVIRQSDHLEGLKENMLKILSTEQDFQLRHLILDAMSQMFRTECDNWPQLIQFVEALSNASDEPSVELFLSVFTSIISYLPINTVGSLFESLCGKSRLAIASQSMPVILAGSHLLTVMLTLISTEQEIILALFMDMLNAFYILLQNQSPIAGEVLSDACEIIRKTDKFCDDPTSLLPQIFTICADNSIPCENRCIVTDLLCVLIEQYRFDFEPASSQIISLSLQLASSVVIDGCFEEQHDVMFSVRPIETLSRVTNPTDFFLNFWDNVAIDTPEKVTAAATAVSSYIENIPEIISIHFSDVFEFAIECIGNPQHCVKEAGFSIIYQLVSRHYTMLSDLYERLMSIVLPIFQCDHEPLICAALTFVVELLYLVEIEDQFLEPLLGAIVSLVPKLSVQNRHLAINGLAAIILSSNESISFFVNDLIPILQQAASHNPTELPLVTAAGVEALSYLIKYAPNETTPVHQFTFERIHQCLQFEDTSLFSSCMISLKHLATSPIFIINGELLFNSMIKVLQIEPDVLGNETAVYSAIIEAKQTALALISTLVKYKPDVIAPFIGGLVHFVVNHFEIDDMSIQSASLKASLAISQAIGNSNPQVLNALINKLIFHLKTNFESRHSEAVAISFNGFAKLVNLHLQIDPNMLKGVIETAFYALKMNLNCQQEDESLTIELSDEVFGFFAVLAQVAPEAFPFEHFFNYTQKLVQQWQQNKIEDKIAILIECIGVLVEYYAVASSNIQSLFAITLRQWFFETLKTCTMEYPPHPISAVRCYIETTNKIKPDELQAIIGITSSIFVTEFSGQTYYWNTVANAISVLLSILRIGGPTSFDISQVMPKILSLLPKSLCESESDNIIMSLIWCCNQIPNFMEQFGQEVLRILTQLLSLKNKAFSKLKLSADTITNSILLINTIRGSVQQSDQLIQGWLNKYSISRFQKRIQQQQ